MVWFISKLWVGSVKKDQNLDYIVFEWSLIYFQKFTSGTGSLLIIFVAKYVHIKGSYKVDKPSKSKNFV